MICSNCGGGVYWVGPITGLTHTECLSCGGKNCQESELPESSRCNRCNREISDGLELGALCDDCDWEDRQEQADADDNDESIRGRAI